MTAEEIRMVSQELESALGGLYSLLSNEMQLPLVNRLMGVMQKKKNMPKLPKDLVNPVIVTGIEALGRGHDLQKLDAFLPEHTSCRTSAIATYVNIDEYFKRRATSLGIKTAGLIKSQEEIMEEMQKRKCNRWLKLDLQQSKRDRSIVVQEEQAYRNNKPMGDTEYVSRKRKKRIEGEEMSLRTS